MNTGEKTVGVIVGRFQVAKLHKGHRDLIEYVAGRCDQVLIVLGVCQSLPNARNPIPYSLRKAMISKLYPSVQFAEIRDNPSDSAWSQNLDQIVSDLFPEDKATMYGSRDSFLEYYDGVFPKEYFAPINDENGTKVRRQIAKTPQVSSAFLDGIIYVQATRQPMVYPTVDVAIVDFDRKRILLGAKSKDDRELRFVGGFVDSSDESYEAAARREAYEETSGLEMSNYRYLGSYKIDDWRYRGSEDEIMTSFFVADYIFGAPRPGDDIEMLEWVNYDELLARLVPEHQAMGQRLLEELSRCLKRLKRRQRT